MYFRNRVNYKLENKKKWNEAFLDITFVVAVLSERTKLTIIYLLLKVTVEWTALAIVRSSAHTHLWSMKQRKYCQ